MPAKTPSPKSNRPKAISIAPGSAWGNNPKFTIAEAAVALGLPRRTVYDHIHAGRLKHVQLGSQLFVRKSHMDEFIAAGERSKF